MRKTDVRRPFLTGLLCLAVTAVFAAAQPRQAVVIDTDGAPDDMRAISMMLAAPELQVLAVTGSQGSLPAASSARHARRLLDAYHHEGVPVGIGEASSEALPPWRGFAEDFEWGPTQGDEGAALPGAAEVLRPVVLDAPGRVTLVALGGLQTYTAWLEAHPRMLGRIARVVWYAGPDADSFNRKLAPGAAEQLAAWGLKLEVVAGPEEALPCGPALLERLAAQSNPYARRVYAAHQDKKVLRKARAGHMALWDDWVGLYLQRPDLFVRRKAPDVGGVLLRPADSLRGAAAYRHLASVYASASQTPHRVFEGFPVQASLYKEAVAGILDSCLRRHGTREWKAVVITNEVHGHTGIYSIVGAKMGVRALEYFQAEVNQLEALTYAGRKPPLSCFNDGLQISTGATVGQGLLTVADTVLKTPVAEFRFRGQAIRMRLREAVAQRMRRDLRQGIAEHGLLTPAYWDYVEALGLRYWLAFDRHAMFTLEPLNHPHKP